MTYVTPLPENGMPETKAIDNTWSSTVNTISSRNASRTNLQKESDAAEAEKHSHMSSTSDSSKEIETPTNYNAVTVGNEKMTGETIASVENPHGDDPHGDDEVIYPTGLKLFLISIALCLSVFLVALDNTIIATAIPKITDRFQSLNDVGWYASSYLLTTCALQLFFGK